MRTLNMNTIQTYLSVLILLIGLCLVVSGCNVFVSPQTVLTVIQK